MLKAVYNMFGRTTSYISLIVIIDKYFTAGVFYGMIHANVIHMNIY